MCAPPMVMAAVATAASTMIGGMQANAQGNYESKISQRNAQMERDAARDSIERGQGEARTFWRDVGRTKGEQIASMAANGIDVGYGSAARLQDDTATLADEDAANLYRNINERTKGSIVNAQNFVAEAKAAKMRGRAALVGSAFESATSLMSAFAQQKLLKAKLGGGKFGRVGG